MQRTVIAFVGLFLGAAILPASAADLAAGKAVFERANCASCHGADAKTSVQPNYPILAGQHADYLMHALRAYRRGQAGSGAAANVRRNPIMGALAVQLSDEDVTNVSAWLASLPGPLRGGD